MSTYLELPVSKKGSVKIALSGVDGLEEVGVKDVIKKTQATFRDVMDTVETCAYGFAQRISEMESELGPDKASLEFGVSISGEVGSVVARASSEGTFKVILTWEKNSK